MKRISRRKSLLALVAAPLMVLAACATTPATATPQSLLHIEVDGDVSQATAHILLDGTTKGVVGPACTLVLLVDIGTHRLEYAWQGGVIGRDVEIFEEQVTAVRIARGPEIVPAPARGPQNPVCA